MNDTKDLKLRLSANEDIKIHAFADASYGWKSHPGGKDILGK